MSLTAAPHPVTKPYIRPLLSVRCTHNIPVGPIGADATIPIIIPFTTISSNEICATSCCKKSFCCKKSLISFIITKMGIFYEIVCIFGYFFYLFARNSRFCRGIIGLYTKNACKKCRRLCRFYSLCQQMNSSSRYLGSVHNSLSTISSRLSTCALMDSSIGATVSW